MKRTLLLSVAVLLTAVAHGFSQSNTEAKASPTPAAAATPEKITIKTKVTAKDYDDLLKKLMAGDTTINFAKLRLAYTETKDYAPYGGNSNRDAMVKAYREKDWEKVVKAANDFLKVR